MADDFEIIPPDLLALASPAERKSYAATLRRRLALSSPAEFGLATDPKFRDWPHVRLISDRVAALPPGGRLLVLCPPRSGKSHLLSEKTPAWIMANDPDTHIIMTSYSDDLAGMFGRRVRNILVENTGLCPRLDPQSKAQGFFNVHPHDGAGSYRAAGVGTGITGMAANWLIFDDLVKSSAEASSKNIRDSTWEWVIRTAMTRLEPGARVVGLMTPWHEDDAAGRLIETEEFDVLRLPALAEEDDPLGREPGEALNPERYTVQDYEQIQRRDPHAFAALYQGRPSPVDGDVFKAANLLEYTKLPEKGYRFAALDLAHSLRQRADYTVLTCFFVSPAPNPKMYVTHVFRDRVDSGEHMAWVTRSILTLSADEKPAYIMVEDKTYGSTLLSAAKRHPVPGVPFMRPFKVDTDKVTRAQTAASMSTQGMLLLKAGAPWLEDVRHELFLFPSGAHDDCVDTISMGALEFQRFPQIKRAAPAQEVMTPEKRAEAHIHRLQRKPSRRSQRKRLLS